MKSWMQDRSQLANWQWQLLEDWLILISTAPWPLITLLL